MNISWITDLFLLKTEQNFCQGSKSNNYEILRIVLYANYTYKKPQENAFVINYNCAAVEKKIGLEVGYPILKTGLRNYQLARNRFVWVHGGTLKLYFHWKVFVYFFFIKWYSTYLAEVHVTSAAINEFLSRFGYMIYRFLQIRPGN